MICDETKYQEALARLHEQRKRLDEHRAHLAAKGLSEDELKRAMDPLWSFHLQLEEEVRDYERRERGKARQR